jgi:hypothetical protein
VRITLLLSLLAALGCRASAEPGYRCTQIMGVSVTGDWFNAGFEQGLENGRWQALWRTKAFIELWADPKSELWSLPPQSPCAHGSQSPDHVIFTGVNWTFTTRAQWEEQFTAVVANLEQKYPGIKRIDLLTMLRGPKNQSCGNPKTVVAPAIDEAIAAVVAKNPGLVFAAPRVEVASCDVFIEGGPHYPDDKMPAVARLYRAQLAR